MEDAREEQSPAEVPKISSSLFPLSISSDRATGAVDGASEIPRWLQNPSFIGGGKETTAFRASYDLRSDEDGEEEQEEGKPEAYELVGSSPSSDDRRLGIAGEKKRKKKKRRRRESEEGGRRDRKSSKAKFGARAAAQSGKLVKDYYIDTRGDPDNLEFGSLYRMNVSRYKIFNIRQASHSPLKSLYKQLPQDSFLHSENDLDMLDDTSKTVARYCSAKFSAWERQKGFKRLKIISAKHFGGPPPEFIPFGERKVSPEREDSEMASQTEVEESWEDEMLRRTREFNRKTRESPEVAKFWMEFADFQDQIMKRQPQKAARLQTLEKKITILEKAVELNPENEELLLSLLCAYQKRDNGDVLTEKWVQILSRHSSSYKLWMEFLHMRESDFSRFKVSDIRRSYAHAIQALSSACSKLSRQIRETAVSEKADPSLLQLEFSLVDIFISLCRFEWQTGHRELATGLFQAEIEFSLFCPSLLLSMQNKQLLFEHFWTAGCARVGEDEALGWAAWLEKEEENKMDVVEDTEEEAEDGGWSGWYKPSLKDEEISAEGGPHDDLEMAESQEEEEEEEKEEDVETLLRKLGIDTSAEPLSEISNSETWHKWSTEECSRESVQWMPVHENSGSGKVGDEQLSRVILFEDVREYLFSLCTEEARFRLVVRFIDFYGGRVSQWACTNSASWIEDTLSLGTTPTSILNFLGDAALVTSVPDFQSSLWSLNFTLEDEGDKLSRAEMMRFLRNVIIQCLNSFPRNHILEEALLVAEEQSLKLMSNRSEPLDTPSRPLAKKLLKNDRQDFLLCGVYARREAAHGNIDLARKVFDMALLSLNGLPPDLKKNAPFLYFWYADMEMEEYISSGSENSSKRAVHILSHLGSGSKYEPFKTPAMSPLLLRCRQGFKEQMRSLGSSWARGEVENTAVALLCSALLFEMLTSGLAATNEVLEEALYMVLPETRTQSLQIEALSTYYISLLQRNQRQLNLNIVWKIITQGLQTYPHNPRMSSAMVDVCGLFTVQHKIRRAFDEICRRNPSVVAFLFAMSYELRRGGSEHRIRGLFERALSEERLRRSVLLWRCYLAYEASTVQNFSAARSKALWLDGFQKLSRVLTPKELGDLQEVMRDKELNLRTDIYEILLQDEI
ncbi:uncharacterized protein LOC144713437 isoform X2 [Wolffia australiana]